MGRASARFAPKTLLGGGKPLLFSTGFGQDRSTDWSRHRRDGAGVPEWRNADADSGSNP
jgi:hypothetical protein